MVESRDPLLEVEQALRIVLAQAVPLAPVWLSLSAARGHILAAAVTAAQPLPPFPASVKDGYAVVAADGPGDYPVIGAVTAGRVAEFALQPGTVAYITTGAPLPAGADAVVMVEETEALLGERSVRVRARVVPGADVRPIGYDLAAGQEVLEAGSRLGAAEIGLLATLGISTVLVYPQPRVALLSTGDELVAAGARLGPGQIYDSNRPALAAAVEAAGGVVVDLGMVGDTRAALAEAVERGVEEADLLLTSGGVSLGELDLLKPLLGELGVVHFGRLRMKPGKPCTFATVERGGRRRLVFALPGNPASSLVTFYLLGVPALRRLAGWAHPQLVRVQVCLEEALRLDPERPEYHRVVVRWEASRPGGLVAASTGNQASSRLLSLRSANALLELPRGEGLLAAGSSVSALLIGDLVAFPSSEG